MSQVNLQRIFALLLSLTMIGAGIALIIWALDNMPSSPPSAATAGAASQDAPPPAPATAIQDASAAPAVQPNTATPDAAASTAAPPPTATPAEPPILLAVDPGVPPAVADVARSLVLSGTGYLTATGAANATLQLNYSAQGPDSSPGRAVHRSTYVAATRFDTVALGLAWADLQALWRGDLPGPDAATTPDAADELDDPSLSTRPPLLPVDPTGITAVAVLSDTLPALTQVLGEPGPLVEGVADPAALEAAAWRDQGTLVLLPFDRLTPRLAVFPLDGNNPLENANRFDAERYPLVATLYAHDDPVDAREERLVEAFLAQVPATNRDPEKLTVLAMTGVTAMVRLMADQMDRLGTAWPAEVVGPELAAADITHISNEVPFVPGCVTNTDPNNFNFCSPPEYMEALRLLGVDIIGLTGNHQNDYGRDDALVSLEFYVEEGLPVYGGGVDKEAAFAPFFLEHNGNRLAFLGANSYGPAMAWATDSGPGSAQFDLAIMSATIRNIKEKGLADLVLPELQYQETYNVQPLFDQRDNFKALVRAGADIVTGVQSHVPQAIEFTDGKLVLYGLGNLYFDQMWSMATREGLVVKHTIYDGRHLSTQVLPTLLYNYGQPRWALPAERVRILERVFGASYW